jgi:hypothetical protein
MRSAVCHPHCLTVPWRRDHYNGMHTINHGGSRRAPLGALALLLSVSLLSGCGFILSFTMPEATEPDIQAAFGALAEAHDYAQAGATIVTDVPSTTTYTSSDGSVVLTVALSSTEGSPFPAVTNTYTLTDFTAPASKIVVSKASFTVTNVTDGWSETTKDEEGSADFSSAGTVQRLDFDLSDKYPAWGSGVLYLFRNDSTRQANYKDFSTGLKVPMIP